MALHTYLHWNIPSFFSRSSLPRMSNHFVILDAQPSHQNDEEKYRKGAVYLTIVLLVTASETRLETRIPFPADVLSGRVGVGGGGGGGGVAGSGRHRFFSLQTPTSDVRYATWKGSGPSPALGFPVNIPQHGPSSVICVYLSGLSFGTGSQAPTNAEGIHLPPQWPLG